MPQSLSSVYLHVVFSTKDRFPFLSDATVRREVHAFLGGIAKNRDCPPLLVGGVADHVHVLLQLGRTVSQADLVKELKRISNIWIRERFPQLGKFSWQAGYGAFSVSFPTWIPSGPISASRSNIMPEFRFRTSSATSWRSTGLTTMNISFGTDETPSGLIYRNPYTQGSFATLGCGTLPRWGRTT